MNRRDFGATKLDQRQADGHRSRTGHQLTGYYESEDGEIWQLTRTCCASGGSTSSSSDS